MTGPEPIRPEPGLDAGIDDLQADIDKTRKDLGETVDALSAELDVKQQAKDKAAETKERVFHRADVARHAATDNPQKTLPVVAVVLIGALVAGIVVWRRRR